ncbi:MAG: anhydro-N-acetylmuramic acid kinase [Actinomycetota bacterium]
MLALGLMSGTSLDGVDAALVLTDGVSVERMGPATTVPYDDGLRDALRSVLGGVGDVAEVERRLTLVHADVVKRFLDGAGVHRAEVDVIGFHGHTILHRPAERRTWQIGDGALLAETLGIPVVNDFRSDDVAAGGQGAPLVPVYHRALGAGVARPLAVLNLGGVGNVTWIGDDDALLAFDTGPGNALIDDWALAHTGRPVDEHGALARMGAVDGKALGRFRAHPYFVARPPKSLDRDDFRSFAAGLVAGLSAADGAATLTAFTAAAVALAKAHFPKPAVRWLVCGGGRHNPQLMAALRQELAAPVDPVEAVGWDGDALEAQAFAYLAVRSLRGLPLTFPETTGGPAPSTGGRSHMPFGRVG